MADRFLDHGEAGPLGASEHLRVDEDASAMHFDRVDNFATVDLESAVNIAKVESEEHICQGTPREAVETADDVVLAICSVVSPLQMDQAQAEGMFICADYGQPLAISPEGIAGATAPVTLAGLLAQENAGILAHITLAQIYKPGMHAKEISKMRKQTSIFGQVEKTSTERTCNILLPDNSDSTNQAIGRGDSRPKILGINFFYKLNNDV